MLFRSALIQDLVKEHNIIRKNPKAYIPHLEKHLTYFKGNVMYKPGTKIGIQTNEGKAAYDECIKFLKNQKALGEVTFDEKLSRASQDHADDIGPKGMTGHDGSDGSNVDDRISRYVDWDVTILENCDFGSTNAVDIIISLIVDDGVSSRGHRSNIFNAQAKFVGVGLADHTEYGICTVLNYCGGINGYKDAKSSNPNNSKKTNEKKSHPNAPTQINNGKNQDSDLPEDKKALSQDLVKELKIVRAHV